MKLNASNRSERYMLKGSLKKSGFDHWRLVTCGSSASTGEEQVFFIEFYIVNPSLSPDECVLGFKSRSIKSETDLQYALAGTDSAKDIEAEKLVVPSFGLVKAGCMGVSGKQMNAYYPTGKIEIGHPEMFVKFSGTEGEPCILTSSSTNGSVYVSVKDSQEQPELLSQPGRMSWNLKFTRQIAFSPDYRGKTVHWSSYGARTLFEGRIVLDGEEYIVTPEKSFGYIDKNWGKDFVSPFFHINASNFTSLFNGKHFQNSCIAIQGVYNDTLSLLTSIEGSNIEYHADSCRKFSITYECIEMPEDEDGIKLHWTVSAHDRKHVIDVDIYCNTREMFVRDYESPAGGRKVLKVLGGGSGTGELRIYRRIKKNLELMEHVRIANAVCEYGNIELPSL